MSNLKGLIELAQGAVDKGTTAVEEVHKAIMNEPIELLKKIPSLEKPAKGVQDVQNQIIGGVYQTIRTANQRFNEIAKDLLGEDKPRKKKMK
jgi:hypothetical protein